MSRVVARGRKREIAFDPQVLKEIDALAARLGRSPEFVLDVGLSTWLGAPKAGVAAPLCVVYQGSRYPLAERPFVIGRGHLECDLVIRDVKVSRQHARIEWRDGGHWIRDVSTANGVFYDGTRVEEMRIDDGDLYRVGTHDLLFVRG